MKGILFFISVTWTLGGWVALGIASLPNSPLEIRSFLIPSAFGCWAIGRSLRSDIEIDELKRRVEELEKQ
jgi:hypothetical protein